MMDFLECRGEQRREYIVLNYTVTPIAHLKLLANQTVKSCAGGTITDEYYVFRCREKKTYKEYIINCGYVAAEDLAKKSGKKLPTVFNPLLSSDRDNIAQGEKSKSTHGTKEKWNPLMRQLQQAIMLLIIAWNYRADSALLRIREETMQFPNCKPFFKYIKALNTILKNAGRTMPDVIREMALEGNKVRQFDFSLLAAELECKGIIQHII